MFNFAKLESIPVLPKRQNNLNKFSTYIVMYHQNHRLTLQWKPQPSLQRNLKLYEDKDREFYNLFYQSDKEVDIAHFWRKIALNASQLVADWQPENKTQLAYEHLASYFEEKCYWTAKDLCKDYNAHAWEEYLYIARLLVHNPLKLSEILVKYNSRSANLETYISHALTNYIKSSAEVKRFSQWRLLYKKSDKELKEALEVLGIVEPEISQFIFARKYFKQVYLINKVKSPARKTGKKWVEPELEDFEQSARCYNAEKLLATVPHEVSTNSTQVTAKQIQEWMETCITALKNYPKSILPKFSLDALQSEGFEASSKLQADVVEVEWQEISTSEDTREDREYLLNKANSILSDQLQVMKPDYQKILLLYYGFGLNQKQLAARLNINQSTISRYLAKSTIQLLETLAGISQPQQWVQQYVEKWLKRQYRAPVHSDLIQAALVSTIKKLTTEQREILQLYYGQRMATNKVAERLGIRIEEITIRLTKAKNQLQDNLMYEIDVWIKEFLEKWLSNYYQSLVESVLKTAAKSSKKEIELEEKITLVEMYIQNTYQLVKID